MSRRRSPSPYGHGIRKNDTAKGKAGTKYKYWKKPPTGNPVGRPRMKRFDMMKVQNSRMRRVDIAKINEMEFEGYDRGTGEWRLLTPEEVDDLNNSLRLLTPEEVDEFMRKAETGEVIIHE